jgi:hypothetical protein
MVGRSSLSRWVHSRPTSTHLFISASWWDPSNSDGSNSSSIRPASQAFQAWQVRCKHYYYIITWLASLMVRYIRKDIQQENNYSTISIAAACRCMRAYFKILTHRPSCSSALGDSAGHLRILATVIRRVMPKANTSFFTDKIPCSICSGGINPLNDY